MIFRNQTVTFYNNIEILNVQEDTDSNANPIYITDNGIIIKRPEESKELIGGDGINLTESGSPGYTELTISIDLDESDTNNPLSIDNNGNLVFDSSILSDNISGDFVSTSGDSMTGALLFNGSTNKDNSIGTSTTKAFSILYNNETRLKINNNIEASANIIPDTTDSKDLGGSSKRWNTIFTDNVNLRNNTNSYFYIGDESTDGSWRFFVNSSGELEFQKRIGGVWEYRSKFI